MLPPLRELFAGRELLLTGATGFVGKVFLEVLLRTHPEIGRVYVLVRAADAERAAGRLREEIAESPPLRALAEKLGPRGFERAMARVEAVAGDLGKPGLGLDAAARARLASRLDAVVHVAGLVDFLAPLDRALAVNTLGVANVLDLVVEAARRPRRRHPLAFVHVSTCYVAGKRAGTVPEEVTYDWCPRAGRRDCAHFSVDAELADCERTIARRQEESRDAARRAALARAARAALAARGRPEGAEKALGAEVERQRRRWVTERLREDGLDRAKRWGWPNTYTYTKSLGEQLVVKRLGLAPQAAGTARGRGAGACAPAAARVNAAVVRPAVVESALAEPFPGWNQGVNTSAPLIYLAERGHRFYPAARDLVLDVIPVDLVAHGLILVLAACLAGRQQAVYQLATGAENPFTMARLIELTGLARARAGQTAGGSARRPSALGRFLAEKVPAAEPVPVGERFYRLLSAPALARIGEGLDALLGTLAAQRGGGSGVARALGERARKAGATARRIDRAISLYRPYIWELRYRFVAERIRVLRSELRPADRRLHPYAPERIDWRHYWMEVHLPGVRRWSLPRIEEASAAHPGAGRRIQASGGPAPQPPWRTVGELLDVAVARNGGAVALRRVAAGRAAAAVSYAELGAAAARARRALLAAGVRPGDRVALIAENSPQWVEAFFGIVGAGAVAVPLDPGLDPQAAAGLLQRAAVKAVVAPEDWRGRDAGGSHLPLEALFAAADGPEAIVFRSAEDLAAIIFTSGTAGGPKGVRLTHRNLLSLVAALAPLFPLAPGDVLVSCLPLHHSFELTCGLLLPLARGAAVTYISPVDGTQLARAVRIAPPTALVGVPALWQLLARRIRQEAAARGSLAGRAFDALVAACARVRRESGVNVGRVVFDRVHRGLGGRLRYLISGAATLPRATEEFFSGLGFDLYEGYGLTEAAPVLAVNRPGDEKVPGSVGRPVPGVALRIRNPDRDGVGEILARGPNIMDGYEGDAAATRRVLRDGWLATGDLGKLDGRGRLTVVGRLKDVIVTAAGENVYPDELEQLYGTHPLVREIAVVGVDRGRGEEVGCVIVPPAGVPLEEAERRLRAHVAAVGARLPGAKRVTCLKIHDGELPRTATRKVRREAVRALLAGGTAPAKGAGPSYADGGDGAAGVEPWLRSLLAGLAGVDEAEVRPAALLAEDLGLDSLARVELAARLGERTGGRIAPEAVARAQTVAEVAEIAGGEAGTRAPRGPLVGAGVRGDRSGGARTVRAAAPHPPLARFEPRLPGLVAALGRRLVSAGQELLYGGLLAVRVRGREHIPWDRAVLVVANHASHLDAGLVRHALGAYGREMRTLAARDYFFDTPAKRLLATSFTNLVPFDRGADFAASLAEATALLRRGHVVLAFPEGTRSTTGKIGEFKAGVGYLALAAGVDVLPVRLIGTDRVLPKGSLLPRGREIEARIGPAIPIARLREIAGEQSAAGYRRVAAALREVVVALGEDRRATAAALAAAVESLPGRFRRGVAPRPVTYYLALGERTRFTVRVEPERCEVVPGRAIERADCVLKTTPRLFLDLVEDGHGPSAAAVARGELRTNDPELLGLFQRAFDL